jgi:hypothetical protein
MKGIRLSLASFKAWRVPARLRSQPYISRHEGGVMKQGKKEFFKNAE